MNGKDLLTGLGYVGARYYEEAETAVIAEAPRRKLLSRPMVVAAIIALMLFLMGCAWMVMKMQMLTIGQHEVMTNQEEVHLDVLSLQGIEGTPNYLANQEWLQFTESYTPTPVSGWESGEAYWAYSVQDQQMVDKLNEICEKYGLKVIGKPWHEHMDCGEFLSLVGVNSLLKADSDAVLHIPQGRFFTGGSFTVYGTLAPAGTEDALYVTYHCVKKDVFYDVFAYVLPGSVTEEAYTTEQGISVLLLESEYSGMILVNFDDSFISVSVDLTGGASLKEIAEQFDFTICSHEMDEAAAAAREQVSIDEANAKNEDKDRLRRATFAEYVQDVLWSQGIVYNDPNLDIPKTEYCFYDLDGNGIQELLMVYNGRIINAVVMENGITNDGKTYNMVLCEGNVLIDKMEAGNDSVYYHIFRFANDGNVVFSNPKEQSVVRLKEENGLWWRTSSTDHYAEFDTQITEEEAMEILNSYPVVELDTLPLSQFKEP